MQRLVKNGWAVQEILSGQNQTDGQNKMDGVIPICPPPTPVFIGGRGFIMRDINKRKKEEKKRERVVAHLQVNHFTRCWGIRIITRVQHRDPILLHLLLQESYTQTHKQNKLFALNKNQETLEKKYYERLWLTSSRQLKQFLLLEKNALIKRTGRLAKHGSTRNDIQYSGKYV